MGALPAKSDRFLQPDQLLLFLTRPTVSKSPAMASAADPDEPSVRYTSWKKLESAIEATDGDVLIVTHVSPNDFDAIERRRDRNGHRFRFFYDGNTQILIVTIPTRVHEALHHGLYNNVIRATTEANWTSIGTSTIRSQFNHPHRGRGSKEADSSGGPVPDRLRGDAWPTLVIEAGYSMSLNQLRHAMRWWFSASNHQVKVVVLAKFHSARAEIILERWEEEEEQSPQGPITRSQAAAMQQHPDGSIIQPVLQQTITITRDETTDPESYHVTGGALVLKFHLLFLRDPGPQEGDIVIGIPALQLFAFKVWAMVSE
ncbi:hypothetical protein B0T25DRAFT_470089 [Lasiosphaeria hispida]|uniref:Uncharacterized protein n=1 Tax=Lasiosphaeria hispida TaxID=260671 RepID=A0AAJ0HWF2_9PEZI|nr:hypothetical protein B0T25DRAFT_470089 [Lasiosphaeria hispida]